MQFAKLFALLAIGSVAVQAAENGTNHTNATNGTSTRTSASEGGAIALGPQAGVAAMILAGALAFLV